MKHNENGLLIGQRACKKKQESPACILQSVKNSNEYLSLFDLVSLCFCHTDDNDTVFLALLISARTNIGKVVEKSRQLHNTFFLILMSCFSLTLSTQHAAKSTVPIGIRIHQRIFSCSRFFSSEH